MPDAARAFWLREPGVGEIRSVPLPEPGPDDVVVRTLRSGISRGTEGLVFRGGVPPSQYGIMRAPFQDGDFPAPVKYGYLSVGVVEHGPPQLSGRTVFCLYPHQTAYVVPARSVMVGCCVARLLARFPGVRVTLVDVDPGRADVASALGVGFAMPADAADGRDLVVHASATSAGLQLSLDLLVREGTVIDLSWYGDYDVTLSLGGAFHSRRLGIRASQVGTVAPARRATRTMKDRLALALELLRDAAFDALLTGSSRFDELPDVMARLAAGSLPAICHTITYGEG